MSLKKKRQRFIIKIHNYDVTLKFFFITYWKCYFTPIKGTVLCHFIEAPV